MKAPSYNVAASLMQSKGPWEQQEEGLQVSGELGKEAPRRQHRGYNLTEESVSGESWKESWQEGQSCKKGGFGAHLCWLAHSPFQPLLESLLHCFWGKLPCPTLILRALGKADSNPCSGDEHMIQTWKTRASPSSEHCDCLRDGHLTQGKPIRSRQR